MAGAVVDEKRERTASEDLGRRPDVAPFGLVRVAVLPADHLHAMRPSETIDLIGDADRQRRYASSVRERLENELYALVPKVEQEDAHTRRQILKLKRDVHNGRTSAIDEDDLARVRDMLGGEAGEALDAWDSALRAESASLQAAESALERERQTRVRAGLRAPLQDPGFRKGLALASQGVATGADKEKELPGKPRPTNLERSLLGYLTRAAGKTTPFSTFMMLASVPFDPSGGDGDTNLRLSGGATVNRVRINRAIVSRLYYRCILESARIGETELHVNPTLRYWATGKIQGLCVRTLVYLGRPWQEQRFTQFRLNEQLAEALFTEPRSATFDGWVERFSRAGIPDSRAQGLVENLYERDVLCAHGLTDAFDMQPERRFLDYLEASRSSRAAEIKPLIEKIDAAKTEIGNSDGQQRAAAVDRIRSLESEALSKLATEKYDHFQNMIAEDCWLGDVRGSIGTALTGPLSDLSDFLSSQVIVSPAYDRMVDEFITRFGEGGVCEDVVDFVCGVGDRLVDVPEYGAKMEAPEGRRPDSGTALGVTAQVQVSTTDGSRNAPVIAVNHVFEGVGWLAARFAYSEGEEQRLLRQKLSDWLEQVHSPREPVDLVLSGQWNDLQAHPMITRRALAWPGESLHLDDSRILRPDGLRLVHNRESGFLELFDSDCYPISLAYLGSSLPNPAWGVPYALSILTQPFHIKRPSFDPSAQERSEGVIFQQRLQYGDVVLRRATWWVASAYLRNAWFPKRGAARIRDVMHHCDDLGIPERFFARPYLKPRSSVSAVDQDATGAARKPMWVDSRNPFCLSMLERLAASHDWIALTEPLPDIDRLWLELDGATHVSEVQLEMIVRSRNWEFDEANGELRAVYGS